MPVTKGMGESHDEEELGQVCWIIHCDGIAGYYYIILYITA